MQDSDDQENSVKIIFLKFREEAGHFHVVFLFEQEYAKVLIFLRWRILNAWLIGHGSLYICGCEAEQGDSECRNVRKFT